MAVTAYTKSGAKSTASVKLEKSVFGVEVKNHDLLKQSYLAYLSNSRQATAAVKTRGLVRGGGAKPHRQKGTGRARSGSSRNPLWTGGGVIFGPTGNENHTIKISAEQKRTSIRQALSLASKEDRIKIIDTFACPDGKVQPTLQLLNKLGVSGRTLIVVSEKDILVERATRNLPNVKATGARYLNVFDILNADSIILSKKAVDIVSEWLGR